MFTLIIYKYLVGLQMQTSKSSNNYNRVFF